MVQAVRLRVLSLPSLALSAIDDETTCNNPAFHAADLWDFGEVATYPLATGRSYIWVLRADPLAARPRGELPQ